MQPLSDDFRAQILQTIADMTLDASAPEYCQGIMDHLIDEAAHHEGYEHGGNPGTHTVTEECLNL